jgi:hypothetical protein
MRKVFKDDQFESIFQQNGYVRMPFLSNDEVEELKLLFFETLSESGGQITSDELDLDSSHHITYDFTFIDKNHAYKRRIFELITERFLPKMDGILENYKPIIANFIRKKVHEGEVPLHQNWAFADEMRCSTVSIWCPLVDSSKSNGTLEVVPGSHKRIGKYRGPMVPWELEGIKHEIIDNYLIPLETKAGDCVILDDSIVHYSAVNSTDDLRLAIQLICIPKEEKPIHYRFNGSKKSKPKIDMLQVDEEFFFQFNPWKFPSGVKTIRQINYLPVALSRGDFDQIMKSPRFDLEFQSNSIKNYFLNIIKRFKTQK